MIITKQVLTKSGILFRIDDEDKSLYLKESSHFNDPEIIAFFAGLTSLDDDWVMKYEIKGDN